MDWIQGLATATPTAEVAMKLVLARTESLRGRMKGSKHMDSFLEHVSKTGEAVFEAVAASYSYLSLSRQRNTAVPVPLSLAENVVKAQRLAEGLVPMVISPRFLLSDDREKVAKIRLSGEIQSLSSWVSMMFVELKEGQEPQRN